MPRRRFLLRVGALAAMLPALTFGARFARVGFLGPRTRSEGATYYDAFVQGLRELGWSPGKNVVIEERWADGHPERRVTTPPGSIRVTMPEPSVSCRTVSPVESSGNCSRGANSR